MFRTLMLFFVSGLFGFANAQHYTGETEFVYPGEPGFNNEVAAIGNKILTYLDGSQGKGIYAYNLDNKGMEKLVSTDTGGIRGARDFKKFYQINGGVIIDDLGRLHWTDGTASATVFLKDFGNEAFGGSAATVFSKVLNVQSSGGSLYVTQRYDSFDGPDSSDGKQLWRVNQSSGEAQLLSDIDKQSLKFISSTEKGVTAFGFDKEFGWSFWRVSNGSNNLEYLTRFPLTDSVERLLSVSKPAITRVGLVFCLDDFSADTETMWRLSSNGKLRKLAEGCRDIKPENQSNSLIYYAIETGLFLSDGRVNGATQIYTIDSSLGESILGLCVFKRKIFIGLITPGNFEASMVDLSSGKATRFKDSGPLYCLDTHAVMRDRIYSAERDLVVPIKRVDISTNLLEIDKNVFVATDPNPFHSTIAPRLLKLEFNEGPFVGFLPPVLEVLLD